VRKPIGLFVAAFATVAGGGLAMALEAPPEEVPPVPPAADEAGEHSQAGDDETDGTDPTTTTVEIEDAETEAVETDAVHPDNHGADVSTAAHECPHDDAAESHGACVSQVARDHDGDGTPDHGPGSPGFTGGAAAVEATEAADADDADDDADDADDDADDDDEHGRPDGVGGGRGA
jgi:hypothetical protein